MTIRGGYQRQILRVDLTRQIVSKEPLPSEDVLRKFIGGTGLGLYYLLKEAPMNVSATDPRAPLLFMTGPLAGTPAPSSANWVTICFHYSIPYAAGVGHGHGFWAAYLKHAGYEGIIITGKAAKPVYLWIDDDHVTLRDASQLWGLGTRETERRIKIELKDEEKISVASIGQAGEAMMPGASVKADRNHGAGKGSPGAIMGSKNLKAIAVRGTGQVPLANSVALLDGVAEWEKNLTSLEPKQGQLSTYSHLRDGGITRVYASLMGTTYRVAYKNMTDPEGGWRYAQNWVDACKDWKVVPQPSYNCKVGCAYNVTMTNGPFAGMTVSFCGGGENTEGAAAMIGVDNPAHAMILTDHYDDIGVEAGTFGAVVGMAFEAYNRGWLTKKDTDGLELTWGNWEAALALIDKMLKREGIGAKLAEGLRVAPQILGREKGLVDDFRKIAVHIKGAGINIHDWRPMWSVLFGYIIAGTGPCHQAMGSDHRPNDDVGYPTVTPGIADTLEGALAKVDSVRMTQFAKVWWDSLGICWFAVSGVAHGLTSTVNAVRDTVGWEDFSNEEAVRAGERIVNAMRLVYVKRGFKKSDEFEIGPRFLEPAPVGPAKGRTIAPYVPAMVDEYYKQLGWDVPTGKPTLQGLRKLGLEEFA